MSNERPVRHIQPVKSGDPVSARRTNEQITAINRLVSGVQPPRQVVRKKNTDLIGKTIQAKTTTQTTGQTLICSLYENGMRADPTAEGVSVYCWMLSSAAIVAVDTPVMVLNIGGEYQGYLATMTEEPA